MRGARLFGGVLARLRRDQGFPNASAFYKSVSGRRTLGLAYANYLNLEQGRSLPRPDRLKRLLSALGLAEESPQARELVRAYLESLLGSEALLRLACAPQEAPGEAPAWGLAEEAARQSRRQRIVRMTLEQYALVNQNPAAMLCHYALVGTPGWVDTAELSRMTGLELAAARSALKALGRAGLIELAAGRARSPMTQNFVALPASVPPATRTFDSLRRYGLLKKKGRLAHVEGLVVRMAKGQMDRYASHLSEAVKLAGVYGNAGKAEDTDVYFVEGGVYRVFD